MRHVVIFERPLETTRMSQDSIRQLAKRCIGIVDAVQSMQRKPTDITLKPKNA